jgi:4-amino-4-deoxy-L-arabinose transferase-like glycosyltransferase
MSEWKVSGSPLETKTAPLKLLWLFVSVAFLVRLLVTPFLIGDYLNPARDHWDFGCETGRLARSLASGHGFSSPLFGDTGPSAWMAPIYPLILAGIFKLFGIYSAASAWVAVSLNCVFGAFTTIPVIRSAQLSFGPRVATFAGWIWVFFPYSIYLSTGRIWNHALAALLLALLFWFSLSLTSEATLVRWLGYGVVWGLAGLTDPSLLTALPCLLAWMIWRRHQQRLHSLVPVVACTLALLVVVSPWFVRNFLVFHRFIPFRDNFWLVLWQSNTGDTSDLYPDWANPPHSEPEMARLQQVGEIAYMQEKRTQALTILRAHPAFFAWVSARRVAFFWSGFWSLYPPYSRNEPFQIPNTFFSLSITVAMLAGLRFARRSFGPATTPFELVLLVFPLLFYVTHPSIDYRHPIDPLIVCLVAVTAVHIFDRHRIAY